MTGPLALIEDEARLRDLLIMNLQEAYTVHGFPDAESFLTRREKEEPALIITDVRLPGMTGIDLLKKARQEFPNTPVVIITAFGSIDQAVGAIKEGAYDYLTKPVTIRKLKSVIERALRFRSSIRTGAPLFPEDARFLTRNPAVRRQLEVAARVSPVKVPVLVLGETGTGKELVAELIHAASGRSGRLVQINCAAIPAELLEGELFGYRKGAFTGADESHEGKLRLADRGTLLLDEVGELPLSLQAKLLRVLERESFYPIGENRICHVDLRVIASTNKDLKQETAAGRFRQDLYYRLAVVPVRIPPLRERREDIPLIARFLLQEIRERGETEAASISEGVLEVFSAYSWPGNVRELRNVLTHMALLARGPEIVVRDLPEELLDTPAREGEIPRTYEGLKAARKTARLDAAADLEIRFVRALLVRSAGNVSRAARAAGMDRRLLQNLIKKYNIPGGK